MKADQELRSLKRGLKVLALLNQTESISITELARRLVLPRTTAERIMCTLLAEGYVQRLPDDKRYGLSPKVNALSEGFSRDCWVVHAASSILSRVTEQIGWPLAIAIPSGDRMVLRATTDPTTSLWLARRRVGAEVALLNSSSGLVAYAFSPPVEQEMLRQVLQRSTDHYNRERSKSPEILDAMVRPVIDNGYAFQPPPNNKPEQSISAPIFVDGKYAASLLMIYITRAMTVAAAVEKYVPTLQRLARLIGSAAAAREKAELPDDLAVPRFCSVHARAEIS